MSYWSLPTTPLLLSKDWIEGVRGSDASFTKEPVYQKLDPLEERYSNLKTRRPDMKVPPTLYAIREQGNGRLALTAVWPVFTIRGGTTWIHGGVMLDKGLARKPSDFGRLFENTLHWLSQPSLDKGTLGGYQQDPLVLKHPLFRKTPAEYFPESFRVWKNQIPAAPVFKGLVGVQTAYSVGQGTVADYAAAARKSGLDFIVFLEEFQRIFGSETEETGKGLRRAVRPRFGADPRLHPAHESRQRWALAAW